MHCVNCGTHLPPGVDNCPNCQAATPYNHRKVSMQPNEPAQERPQQAEEVPQQDFTPTQKNTFPVQQTSDPNGPDPILRAQEDLNRSEPTFRAQGDPNRFEPTLRAQEEPARFEPTLRAQEEPNRFEPTLRAQEGPQPQDISGEATQKVPPSQAYPAYLAAESPYGYQAPTDASAASAASTQPPYQPYAPYNYQPQPPQQRKRTRRSPLMIALVLVVILLIVSAAGLLGYAQIVRPAQLRAQATATAQTIATNDAHASATANAQATATENAQLTATAVANVTATAQAQATVAANQAVLTQATGGTPTISESLAQNSNSNWAEGTATDGSCLFTGGAYHINIHTVNVFLPCFAGNTGFSNFAAQVDMTIVKGNDGGLIFRADPNANHFYIFRVTSDGAYNLAKFVDNTGKNTQVLSDGLAPVIKTGSGKKNTLTIVARNSKLYLYINKQFLANVSDNAYTSGQLGLFAGDSKDATETSFQNLKVWTL